MTRETSLFDRVMRPVKPTVVADFLPEPRRVADAIWVVERRLVVGPTFGTGLGAGGPFGGASGPGNGRRPGAGPEGPVVRGDVVD